MKLNKKIALISGLIALVLFSSTANGSTNLTVSGDPFTEPVKIRCTCYIDQGTTASGAQTRSGVLAGRREWLGYTAILYAVDEDGGIGKMIGIYEFLDTGAGIDTDGDGKGDSIKNGTSIDVWLPTLDATKYWAKTFGDYVYLQIVKAEG